MADVLNSAKEVIAGASDIANDARQMSKAFTKSSLSRLTKDQIFQFPVFLDADIDDDEKFPIIKSIEKNYAQLVMVAITNNGVIDRDRYSDVNDFLRRFHNNSGIPSSMVSVSVTEATATEGYLPKEDLLSMWDSITEQLDSESINDMYKPFNKTAAKLTRAIEAAHEQRMLTAMEASDKKYFRRVQWDRDNKGKEVRTKFGAPIIRTDRNGNQVYQYIEAPDDPTKYQTGVDQYGEAKTMKEWNDERNADNSQRDEENRKTERTLNAFSNIKGAVVKDDKYAALAPTVINMTLANTKKNIGAWSQSLIIGVKAMPRLIPQSLMVNNMIEACKNRLIFKFIQWTNHETNFADLLFGYKSARSDARNMDNRWLKILQKRARRARIPGAKLNPNTTIIITENDTHIVQERCGVNLNDAANVKKIMDKYFLLGFGIYDTEGKMLKIMYDGENEFSHQSLRSMMADIKKEANLLAMARY